MRKLYYDIIGMGMRKESLLLLLLLSIVFVLSKKIENQFCESNGRCFEFFFFFFENLSWKTNLTKFLKKKKKG